MTRYTVLSKSFDSPVFQLYRIVQVCDSGTTGRLRRAQAGRQNQVGRLTLVTLVVKVGKGQKLEQRRVTGFSAGRAMTGTDAPTRREGLGWVQVEELIGAGEKQVSRKSGREFPQQEADQIRSACENGNGPPEGAVGAGKNISKSCSCSRPIRLR